MAQLASSWCPGALKGQLVAAGQFTGSAALIEIGPAQANYSVCALPEAQLPGGGVASPIPAVNVVISLSHNSAASAVVAGTFNSTAALGVSYSAPTAAGSWLTIPAGTTTTATYDWQIFG